MTLLMQPGGSRQAAYNADAPSGSATGSLFESAPAMIILGVCLGVALGWPRLVAVWQSQTFFDTDDAMHMVVLRDWLGGQAWFDLVAHRMDPPQGVLLHWSHVLDVPFALLVRGFELFAPQDTAERLMRIAYPIMLQAALYCIVASIAAKLLGTRGIAVAVILTAFSLAVTEQFQPGRITHHNVQIVLLMLMLGDTIDSFSPRRTWSGAVAGLCAALSLTIGLENLPFIVVLLGSFGVAWVVRGPSMARALARLGGSFAACALVAFAATVPPDLYTASICDAFSGAHLIGAVGGGIGCLVLAAATPRLPTLAWRLAAAALAGGIVVVAVAATFPDCLRTPFAGIDPLVQEVWVENMTEARPLASLLLTKTLSTLPMAMPIFLGLCLPCVAAWRERDASRARWLVVAAFAAIGVLGAFWQVRVSSFAAPITIFGGAWLFVRASRWAPLHAGVAFVVPVLLMMPLLPAAWALALPGPGAQGAQAYGDPQACFASAAFRALDALPPSLVLAPIDAAPYILAFTPHSVIGAPYHRNNHGNRLTIEAFVGDAETAHARIGASGARYLAICPAADELTVYAARAPQGLAALLRDGTAPPWLRPLAIKGSPYQVYEIQR